jgi:sigma-B regulation protein RsbU (phosphoserine phosphatase)
LLRASNGAVSELKIKGNLPLGAFEETRYGETEHMVQAGDSVILYTDGVTEAMNKEGVLLGTEQLKRVIASSGEAGPEALLSAVSRAIAEHTDGFPQSDDVAMVCLSVDQEPIN